MVLSCRRHRLNLSRMGLFAAVSDNVTRPTVKAPCRRRQVAIAAAVELVRISESRTFGERIRTTARRH